MNIFMTGATGYIGGTVARRLLDDGHRLRGLVRDTEKGRKLASFGVEPVAGDLDEDGFGESESAESMASSFISRACIERVASSCSSAQ